jgi:hypothetical protein
VVDENDMQFAMEASLFSYRKENDEEEKLAARNCEHLRRRIFHVSCIISYQLKKEIGTNDTWATH